MTSADIILAVVLTIVVSVIIALFVIKHFYNKGIEAGRIQMLEEDLIRMDRKPANSADQKVKAFYEQFNKTQNHSRQSCKFVDRSATPTV